MAVNFREPDDIVVAEMASVARRIRDEILASGPMRFSRFMELALYAPGEGYYESGKPVVGREGDFFTSVSVGSLFGELLGFQYAEWIGKEIEAGDRSPTSEWQIVELGAHDGQLAHDILSYLWSYRRSLAQRVRYIIGEPGSRWRAIQQERLKPFGNQVDWLTGSRMVSCHGIRGIIFGNELLDAMPVHSLGWDAERGEWFEWGVAWDDETDSFRWTRLTPSRSIKERPQGAAGIPDVSEEVANVLPDGFTVEISPTAAEWWAHAAQALAQGRLLTLDYGLAAEERLMPERAHGTVRAYRGHQQLSNVLADPGSQDLTAHVNFSDLKAAGESAGLKTELWTDQGRFLTRIASETWRDGALFGQWTRKRIRQFQTLTHPGFLGRSFQVLVQSKGVTSSLP